MKNMKAPLLLVGLLNSMTAVMSFSPVFKGTGTRPLKARTDIGMAGSTSEAESVSDRRDALARVFSIASMSFAASIGVEVPAAWASRVPTGPGDGLLDELPGEALRSYLQYRVPLQISADFYMWEVQKIVGDIDEWGEVGQLFRVNNNRGQGQPSRIEREFVNPMRILGLSMPPDISDQMRDSQFKFEKAMFKVSKATAGVRRDLPVEIDKNLVTVAKDGWEEGRQALNEFFDILNEATGLNEMTKIPPSGPNQVGEYGRSPKRYFELVKKTKLCQNRGGPALSQAWGQLMVSGYLQDSCGIPDLNDYFYQKV